MKISASNWAKWLSSSSSTPSSAASPNSQQRPVSTEKQKNMFLFKNFSSFNLTTHTIPTQCGNFMNDSTTSLGSVFSADLSPQNRPVSPKVKGKKHSNLKTLGRLGLLVGASASSPDVRTLGCDPVDLGTRVARANSFQPANNSTLPTETIKYDAARVDCPARSDSLFALNNRPWSSRTSISSIKKIGKTLLSATKASGSLLRPQVIATSPLSDSKHHHCNSPALLIDAQQPIVTSSSGSKYGPLLTAPPSTTLSSVRRSVTCIPFLPVQYHARAPASDGTMTDNTLTELDTKSASTLASSVNEVLCPLRLPNADKNGSNVKENEAETIDSDPTYSQLLKMVDVLSCTVEDLSKKMMFMMEYKESAVSKAHPHRSKDSGARHSRISTKVNCSPRQRRKALPHPPSEAPPRAPDNFHILQSTVSPASSLVSQLHDSSLKAVDTIPSPNSFGTSPSSLLKSSLSWGNTIKSSSGPKANIPMEETGSEQDLQTCASLALEIQQEIQACRSSLTTLLSPVVSHFLSFSTPMQGSPPLSSAQNPNFTACSGAQLSSDIDVTGTAVLSNSASLGKPIELPHARRSSRIRISGDHVPSVGAKALPGCQFSPEGQVSAVVSDKVSSCQPFLKTQNDHSHTSIYDSSLTIDEKNNVHDLTVDSISSTPELNPTYSGDLAHFLELLDSRLTLLERDWPHFLQLHLVHDESLSRFEHETSQALNSHSPTSMAQEYGQHIESTMPEVYSSLAISGPELEQIWDRQLRIDQDLRSLVSRLERLPVGQHQKRHLFGNQTYDNSTSLPDLDGSVELLNQTQEEILEGSGPSIETSLLCTTTASIDAMNTTPHLSWATTSTEETQNLVREIEELRQRVLHWDSVHVPEWNAMYNELHEEILRLKYSDLTE